MTSIIDEVKVSLISTLCRVDDWLSGCTLPIFSSCSEKIHMLIVPPAVGQGITTEPAE